MRRRALLPQPGMRQVSWIAVILGIALVGTPTYAQERRAATIAPSAFDPSVARIYGPDGALIGTARESAFQPGTVRLYNPQGQFTGIETRPNPFDPARTDVFSSRGPAGR